MCMLACCRVEWYSVLLEFLGGNNPTDDVCLMLASSVVTGDLGHSEELLIVMWLA